MIKYISNFSKFVPRATSYLLFLIITSIPFSVRYVFDSPWNFETGAYSDFTSLSIYMSDFAILALIGITMMFHMKHRMPKYWVLSAYGLIAWLFIELYLQGQDLLPLQLYFSLRLVILIYFAWIVSQIDVSREKIAWLFTSLGVFQASLGVFQFILQKSAGLYILGESHLGPDILGVAKIVAHGTKMIRAYGTFPHPNLLAAFLVVSLIFNIYLLTKRYQISRGIFIYAAIFINTLGLFLTFSRGGLLGFGVAMAMFVLILLIHKQYYLTKKILLPLIASVIVSLVILYPYITTRVTITDNSTKQRLSYTDIGIEIIKDNQPQGIGPGLSVLHMKQYSSTNMEPWEIQPIHNYYLIAIAELGIGALGLFLILFLPIYRLYKQKADIWSASLLSVSVGFLTLFLFDHYFYTIWPTQLLLWLIVGLSLKSISRETVSNL